MNFRTPNSVVLGSSRLKYILILLFREGAKFKTLNWLVIENRSKITKKTLVI